VVNDDKTQKSINAADNGSKIITEMNKAYGSRTTLCEEVLETNNYYTQIISDYETGKGKSENHCQPACQAN
jgi:hypothetical protein